MAQSSAALALTPQEAAVLRKAHAALQGGDAAEADRLCRRVLAQKPRQPNALSIRALVKTGSGDFAAAEDMARRALDALPAAASAPSPARAEILNILGHALAGQRRHADAIGVYREAVAITPGQPEFWFSLGKALLDAARPDDAEAALRQALTLNPRDLRFTAAYAAALKNLNRWQDAAAIYRGILESTPDSAQTHYDLGECLFQTEQMEAAAEAFARAARLRPDFTAAHESLANIRFMTERGGDALASYTPAMAASPSLDLRMSYVASLMRLERHDEAEQVLHAARRTHTAAPQVEYSLGRLRVAQGRFAEAAAHYEAALRLMPEEPALQIQLGRALLGAGEARAALDALEQAARHAPFSQLAMAHLGLAYRMLNDEREYALNAYDDFIREYDLPAPAGFANAVEFNAALDQALTAFHHHKNQPLDQTLRGGTQTTGLLFAQGAEAIQTARRVIAQAVADYIAALPEGAHPLLGRRTQSFRFSGSWSCRLSSQGFHTNHIHPEGWISSAYYVALPDAVEKSGSHEGWIQFGQPDLPALNLTPRRVVKPAVGKLVLFPSYMFHGTVPFADAKHRTTIAFDVVPT